MLKSYLASAAAMLALIGCSASALPSESTSAAPVTIIAAYVADAAPAQFIPAQHERAEATCDVVIRRVAGGARIEALVESDYHLEGEYSFDLDVSGGAGSSTISQGGEVSIEAGDSAVLAQNEVSLNRNSRVRAELTIFDADGEVCSRTLRL